MPEPDKQEPDKPGWRGLADDTQRITSLVGWAAGLSVALGLAVTAWAGVIRSLDLPLLITVGLGASCGVFVLFFFGAWVGHRYFGRPAHSPFGPRAAPAGAPSEDDFLDVHRAADPPKPRLGLAEALVGQDEAEECQTILYGQGPNVRPPNSWVVQHRYYGELRALVKQSVHVFGAHIDGPLRGYRNDLDAALDRQKEMRMELAEAMKAFEEVLTRMIEAVERTGT